MNAKRIVALAFAFFAAINGFVITAAASPADIMSTEIVVVVDVSGSVAEYDAGYGVKDALSLMAGLAPDGAQTALVSVNAGVIMDTDFADTSTVAGRAALRAEIESLQYEGNTDLVLGLERAAEKLDGGPGRIILIADISEGGLIPADDAGISKRAAEAEALAENCAASGIAVDLILLGEAPEGNELAAAIEGIATKTGGNILRPESGEELTACMEEILFSAFTYHIWPVTGVNSIGQAQTIPIVMPTERVHRARIYVSGASGIQASYAGAGLDVENRATFSLLDLSRPAREGISLTAEPGSGKTAIYLITDYRLSLDVAVSSEAVKPEGSDALEQVTALTIDLRDEETGKSILDTATAEAFTPEIALTTPEGETITLTPEVKEDGRYTASFQMAKYKADTRN